MFCVSARWALISVPVSRPRRPLGVVERCCLPGQTVVVGAAPETYLRLMAQDLAGARPSWRRRIRATSIQALAHAYVMLGLISPEGAGAAITHASRAPGLRRA